MSKSIPIRSKDNSRLAGSISIQDKKDIPTANKLHDDLVARAYLAPKIAGQDPVAIAYEAFTKIKEGGSLGDLKRVSITGAETSRFLKDTLKERYPLTKFSVRWGGYAGGGSVHVSWTDGPSVKEVDEITNSFSGATFDGTQDLKEYKSAVLTKLPARFELSGEPVLVSFGTDFVFTDRELSPQYQNALSIIAQEIIDDNQTSIGRAFETGLDNYPALGSSYGTFNGGSGYSLLRWLSEKVSPEKANDLVH